MNATAHVPDWVLEFTRLEHHIQSALDRSGNTHSVADIARGVDEGTYQFWSGKDAVFITEIIEYPRKKICNAFLAGGDIQELEEMTPVLEAWAKRVGCSRATLVGRKGWTRSFLRDMGYRVVQCEMSKEI
jgi:hypothetical protein